MSTFPLLSNITACPALATAMPPVAVNVPALGSYSSALARALTKEPSLLSNPPAVSTFPLGNKVAV